MLERLADGEALTEPQFIRQYWFNTTVACGRKKGSPWWKPELEAEGPSRCTRAGEIALKSHPGH